MNIIQSLIKMNFKVYLFFSFLIIIAFAPKTTNLICQRKLVQAFLDIPLDFEPQSASTQLKEKCKNMKFSCCSEPEFFSLIRNHDFKMNEVKGALSQFIALYKLLERLEIDKLFSNLATNKRCFEENFVDEQFLQNLENVLKNANSNLKLVQNFINFVDAYFSEVVCSVCDLQQNSFFKIIEDQNNEHVKYQYQYNNCQAINAVLVDSLPFVADALFALKIARILHCIDKNVNSNIDLFIIDPDLMSQSVDLLVYCNSLSPIEISTHSQCLTLCQNLFTLSNFVDPFHSFDNVRRSVYILTISSYVGLDFDREKPVMSVQISEDFYIDLVAKDNQQFDHLAEVFQIFYYKNENSRVNLFRFDVLFAEEGLFLAKAEFLINVLGMTLLLFQLFFEMF